LGPVIADFEIIVNPCQDQIELRVSGGIPPLFSLPEVDFEYVPGKELSNTWTTAQNVQGFGVELIVEASLSNPSANSLETSLTLDVCLDLDENELPTQQKLALSTIELVACIKRDSTLCKLVSGTKLCGKELSDLVLAQPELKGFLSTLDFKLPQLPLTIEKEVVNYQCTNSVGGVISKTLVGPGGAALSPSSASTSLVPFSLGLFTATMSYFF